LSFGSPCHVFVMSAELPDRVAATASNRIQWSRRPARPPRVDDVRTRILVSGKNPFPSLYRLKIGKPSLTPSFAFKIRAVGLEDTAVRRVRMYMVDHQSQPAQSLSLGNAIKKACITRSMQVPRGEVVLYPADENRFLPYRRAGTERERVCNSSTDFDRFHLSVQDYGDSPITRAGEPPRHLKFSVFSHRTCERDVGTTSEACPSYSRSNLRVTRKVSAVEGEGIARRGRNRYV